MAINKKNDQDSASEALPKSAKKKVEKKDGSANDGRKASNSAMPVIIAIVLIGLAVGGFFIYTQIKLGKLEKGGSEKNQVLEAQVAAQKNEIKNLNQKLSDLEKVSNENKEIVIDLFDKTRQIPGDVDAKDWGTYTDSEIGFTLKLPADWEAVPEVSPFAAAPAAETATADAKAEAPKPAPIKIVNLQPKDQPLFVKAVTFKNDYTNFNSMTLAQKYDVFKGLDLLDERTFAKHKMLYFLDINKNDQVVPTILVLTDTNIYRATFNIENKSAENYVAHRQNFENIVATFESIAPPAEEKKDDAVKP